jgi:hypothetical protein
MIVPTLCVVTAIRTLRVPVTRSVRHGIPTRRVGTIMNRGQVRSFNSHNEMVRCFRHTASRPSDRIDLHRMITQHPGDD